MSAPSVTPDPLDEPVTLNDWQQCSWHFAPDSIETTGDLLVRLLAAFTTSNANQQELLDRIERLEAQVKELSHMVPV